MTHYKLTDETKTIGRITLHRIELTEDCKWGNKGDKGGWIEKESNLRENAWVFGNAWVYGNAWEVSPLQIQGTKHYFNICKKGYIRIGCIEKSIEDWKKEFKKVGKDYEYTKEQIKEYGLYIKLAKQLNNGYNNV